MKTRELNEKEKAFLKDFKVLLDNYQIEFNAWEEYGGDDRRICDEYLFEDNKDFRLEIDEVVNCLFKLNHP